MMQRVEKQMHSMSAISRRLLPPQKGRDEATKAKAKERSKEKAKVLKKGKRAEMKAAMKG